MAVSLLAAAMAHERSVKVSYSEGNPNRVARVDWNRELGPGHSNRSQTPPKMPPIGRLITPEEVAELTAFLLGPHAGAITGQQIVICGGSSL